MAADNRQTPGLGIAVDLVRDLAKRLDKAIEIDTEEHGKINDSLKRVEHSTSSIRSQLDVMAALAKDDRDEKIAAKQIDAALTTKKLDLGSKKSLAIISGIVVVLTAAISAVVTYLASQG